jgi:NAD(P)-dependent dehydrogenase (short-subunit alcohol dehydrogenase family)
MSTLDKFRLDGQVAAVTGALGGIGRAIVEAFQDSGATVVAIDLKGGNPGSFLRGKSFFIEIDVADSDSIKRGFGDIERRTGGIDVLVNNAGVARRGPSVEFPLEDWTDVQNVNLRGIMLCCQAVAPGMLQRGHGSIVNVSSQLGISPTGERAAYVSSKAGAIGLSKSLALEWAGSGVRVNSLAPGLTRTPMTSYLEDNKEAGDLYRQRIPMGRFGDLPEIALACLFLASDASSYVTGHVLVADGGYSVW